MAEVRAIHGVRATRYASGTISSLPVTIGGGSWSATQGKIDTFDSFNRFGGAANCPV